MNDEDKLSRLYQQSRTDEPPLKLDSAVLSHARRAVEKKPFSLSRWLAPMAAVATVMLTASLMIVMKSEHPEVMETNAVMEQMADPVLKEATPAAVEPEIRRDQLTPARSLAPSEEAGSQRQLLQDRGMLKAMPAAPAMQDAVNDAEKKAEGMAGAAVGAVYERAADKVPADDMQKARVLSPEAWLAEILQLHEQGKETEAAASMQQFRLQYPDYKIPADFPLK